MSALNTKRLTIFCCILEFLIKKVHFKVKTDLFFTFILIFSLDLPTYYGWKHDAKCSNISIRVRRPIYYCKVIVCTTKFIPQGQKKTFYIQSRTKDAGGTSHFRLKYFLKYHKRASNITSWLVAPPKWSKIMEK